MEKGISEAEYQNNEESFFKGKTGYLLHRRTNVSGEVIRKNAVVMIMGKMQRMRGDDILHPNAFHIRDVRTGIEIFGIKSWDIDLNR